MTSKPFCRWCGKPIAKKTFGHWFNSPLPQSREDAQRRVNGQITKVNRWPSTIDDKQKAGKIFSANTWDGGSYRTVYGFFCSSVCAGHYAENFADLTGEGHPRWQEAIDKAEGRA
jgi:hypothetical protein